MPLFAKGFDPKTDLIDLKGKVVLVTGGNRGIGYGTIQHLARAGAKVYMAARNEESAKAAIERLKTEGLEPGNGEIVWLKLDLADPKSAKEVAEEFSAKESRLDVLINNAAMLEGPYKIGSLGINEQVVINYITLVGLTEALLPILTKTALEPASDVRIVTVTSIAHKLVSSGLKFEELKDLNAEFKSSLMPGFSRYGYSKLLGLMYSKQLQKRLDAASPPVPITVIAIHPGGVDTFSHKWFLPKLWKPIVGLAISDIEHGSYTSVFAAASKTVQENREKYKGAYLEAHPPGHFATPGSYAQNDALMVQLWNTTEKILNDL